LLQARISILAAEHGGIIDLRAWNWIAWGTSIVVIGMTFAMLWGTMPGH